VFLSGQRKVQEKLSFSCLSQQAQLRLNLKPQRESVTYDAQGSGTENLEELRDAMLTPDLQREGEIIKLSGRVSSFLPMTVREREREAQIGWHKKKWMGARRRFD